MDRRIANHAACKDRRDCILLWIRVRLIAETRRSPTPTAPGGAWGYIFREDIALVDDIDPAGAMEKIVKA